MQTRVTLDAAVRCNVGKVRDNNEDNVYLCGAYRKDVAQNDFRAAEQVSGAPALFAVCDGMGGQENGERASLIAVRHLRPHPIDNVRVAAGQDFLSANTEICDDIRRAGGVRMGATVAALYVDGDRALAGNIGDSRIYLFRGGNLEQLSEDHDEAARMVRLGILTKEQALTDKRRHRLTQHLGLFSDEVIPEAYWSDLIALQEEDRFLVCSDGITDMLKDEQIRGILARKQPAKETADLLVEEALRAGGRDNATALVVDVHVTEQAAAAADVRTAQQTPAVTAVTERGGGFFWKALSATLMVAVAGLAAAYFLRDKSLLPGGGSVPEPAGGVESTASELTQEETAAGAAATGEAANAAAAGATKPDGGLSAIDAVSGAGDGDATEAGDDTPRVVPVADAHTIGGITVIAQNPELPAGCEVTSLTMALQYAGYEADKVTLAEEHLKKAPPTDGASPYECFVGDPKEPGGFGCYADVIADCADSFGAETTNLSGRPFEELLAEVEANRPVVIWITSGLTETTEGTYSFPGPDGETEYWKAGEHCALLYGYDLLRKEAVVADPETGKTEYYDLALLRTRWEEQGRQALVVTAKATDGESSF